MLSQEKMIRIHAKQPVLTSSENFFTLENYCLYLIHLRAYEEAARMAVDKRVLDLGCNNGYGSNVISEYSKEIVGVDVSPDVIKEARRQFKSGNIRFQVIDGKSLPFEDNRFDLVVSYQVIEHIIDYESYFSEIIRVLAPKGKAVFTTPNAALRLDPGMKPWNKFHVREFTGIDLKNLLLKFFENVYIQGLFSDGPLYSIEYNRIKRARENARKFRSKIKDALPVSIVQKLRKIKNLLKKNKRMINFKADQYSTKELFYSEENLEKALDLMAICYKDGLE